MFVPFPIIVLFAVLQPGTILGVLWLLRTVGVEHHRRKVADARAAVSQAEADQERGRMLVLIGRIRAGSGANRN